MRRCHVKWLVLALLAVGWFVSVSAQANPQADIGSVSIANGRAQYNSCIRKSESDPLSALEAGMTWRDLGGGLPAQHCVALAMARLGQFEQAAKQLEVIAFDLSMGKGLNFAQMVFQGDREVLADVYSQAGNVWLMAGEHVSAYDNFSYGLQEAPPISEQALELYVDRARASGYGGDYVLALEDLDVAFKMDPSRRDVMIYIATAHTALEHFEKANETIDKALDTFPDHPDLLLERGNISLAMGNVDAARLDWVQLVALHPDSYASETAKAKIKKLEELEAESTSEDAEGDSN